MFTGIVQAVGEVARIDRLVGDTRLHIDTKGLSLAGLQLGDSVAVNGVCLTVTQLGARGFAADVSIETLTCTTLRDFGVGTWVNLERALTAGAALGGHLVSGHVDGVAQVREFAEAGRSRLFEIEAPASLAPYIAAKGSITIDGVSLTVNGVERANFFVNLVPHTLEVTTLGRVRVGQAVNLEVDMIARYVERLLAARDLR